MYEAFTGEIIGCRPTEVILDVRGIAFRFAVPLSTSESLPASGTVRLLAHLVVREDKLELLGFSTDRERILFRHLISVSGIGPAIALQVLSRAPVPEFVQAVCGQDRAYLNSIKGVGKKTVDRILVELSEPLQKWLRDADLGETRRPTVSPVHDEAVKALGTLGLSLAAARKAVEKATQEIGADAELDELVRAALTVV